MNKLDKTFKINPLYESDGYKVGHKAMLAEGTTKLYGTWIPRTLKYVHPSITKVMSAGQQLVVRYLHSTFAENFFFKTEREASYNYIMGGGMELSKMCDEKQLKEKAMKFVSDMSKYLGMEYDGKHFEDLWDLGYLPIKIKALPEGLMTPPNIPHMTFINTVDGYAWLTLFLETYISKLAWQMPTAATIAHQFKKNAVEWVSKTDKENLWLADFMCHDFHSRGGNPFTSIAVGLGHAISHKGSDTLNVIPAAEYYYDEEEMPVFSVNASEHSVSTTKIFTVGEQQMLSDWMKTFPKGILSVVSDTFDLWQLITEYLPNLKEEILARDGKLVIRPDSGNPVDIICGTNYNYKDLSTYYEEGKEVKPETFENILLDEVRSQTPHGELGVEEYENIYSIHGKLYKVKIHNISYNRYDKQYYFIDMYEKAQITIEALQNLPEHKGVVELLWDIFGGTINEQGYKVLDSHIGCIYGDAITLERQVEIYRRLEAKGFAATNIVVGVGSYTYVLQTRDTLGYAAKGSWFEVKDSELGKAWYNIYKDPITDDGQKRSLKGLLQVYETTEVDPVTGITHSEIGVHQKCGFAEESKGLLKEIYIDGEFFNQVTLSEIRKVIENNNE